MHSRYPLGVYIAGVLIVMAAVITLARYLRGPVYMWHVVIFCFGFLLGMLAMYIAVHVYGTKLL